MKLKQDENMRVLNGFGHALGKRARSMSLRFDFAAVEALRRELLEGRLGCAPAGNSHAARRRAEFLR